MILAEITNYVMGEDWNAGALFISLIRTATYGGINVLVWIFFFEQEVYNDTLQNVIL